MADFENETWPMFLKKPGQYLFVKVDGKQKIIHSIRVQLLDGGEGFVHQRKKRSLQNDNDFGEALDHLVDYELSTERDYMITMRDYFRKELEARSRFESIYKKFMGHS